ncbi:MAG: amidohydrolase [Marinisporobacter sp.]|jgi:aminobenzoyl-glutamate utilization protein A|nr:amidohydrolase [Marinisporobacter sp.]
MDKNFEKKIIGYRREFHKYAETSWKEFRTTARIAEVLNSLGYNNLKMGLEVVDPNIIIVPVRLNKEEKEIEMKRAVKQGAKEEWVKKTKGYPGLVVELDTGIDGPTTAFRFDIDALCNYEIHEKGHRPYDEGFASVNENSVHACGHDGHTAIGLGLAEKIIGKKEELKGVIKLIFQPSEEGGPGAASMVKKGVVDTVDYLFTMHLCLSHEGKPLPSNTLAAGCSDFLSIKGYDVYFEGNAAHPCGASQEGKNALLAACTAALNIHSIAPHEEGLFRVNVGEIHAGVGRNTIAPNAHIKLEVRGENDNITEYGKNRILTILESAANMYDLKYELIDYGGTPSGNSDEHMIELVKEAAETVEWFKEIYDYGNVGGSDDATVMMKRVQERGGEAVYFGIGADSSQPLHNCKFDFDENALIATIDLCMNLIKKINRKG